jgi:hypothetical protein
MMKYLYLAVFSSLLGFAIAHAMQSSKPQAVHPGQEFHQEAPGNNRFIAFPLFSAQPDSTNKEKKQASTRSQAEKNPDKSIAWRLEEASMYFIYRLLRGFVHLYH